MEVWIKNKIVEVLRKREKEPEIRDFFLSRPSHWAANNG